jgi:hypothetical protein
MIDVMAEVSSMAKLCMPSSYKPSLADGNSHQRMTAIRVMDRATGFQ